MITPNSMINISKNFIFTFVFRCITILSGFIVSILTAHYLGPSGRGDYYFVITLSAVLVQIGNLGMHASNVYIAAKNNNIIGNLVSNAIWVSLIIGITFAVGAYIIMQYRHNEVSGIGLIAILAPSTLFFLLGINLLIAINKVKIFNIFQIISSLAIIAAALACGVMGMNASGFLAFTSFTWLIISLLLIYTLSKYANLSFRFNFDLFQQGFCFGIKTYLATFFGLLVLKSNIFLLKEFTSGETLGYYSIAAQISDALITLPTTFSLLLFPDLVKDPTNRWRKTKKTLLSVSILMIPVYLFITLTAKFIIPIIFGVQFSPSVPILILLLPGSFCLGITSITSQYLAAHNFPISLVIIWIIGFVLMIISSLILIPKFSAQGAACGLSITYILICAMVIVFSFRFNHNKEKLSTNLGFNLEL